MKTINQGNHVPRFKALLELPMLHTPSVQSLPLGIALAIFLFISVMSTPVEAASSNDPLEQVNRVTHQFNRVVDKVVVKPLATSYQRFTPGLIKLGVKNFFNNLDDVRVSVNDILQLKFAQAASDIGRLAVNSTLGVGGLIDVAGPAFHLEKNRQDFGKTLAFYGVKPGPYLVLPLIGPSTARDAFGFGFDSLVDPVPAMNDVETRNGLLATKSVDRRARVLGYDDMVIGDDYLFLRGIYLQYREFEINGEYAEVAFEEF